MSLSDSSDCVLPSSPVSGMNLRILPIIHAVWRMECMKTKFEFRPPIPMIAIWALGSVLTIGFALLPWIVLVSQNGGVQLKPALLIVVAWSSLPFGLGIFLAYLALQKTKISVTDDSRIRFERTCFFLSKARDLKPEKILFVKHVQHRHRRVDEVPTIMVTVEQQRYILANEYFCGCLDELFAWLTTNTEIDCNDQREGYLLRDRLKYC